MEVGEGGVTRLGNISFCQYGFTVSELQIGQNVKVQEESVFSFEKLQTTNVVLIINQQVAKNANALVVDFEL